MLLKIISDSIKSYDSEYDGNSINLHKPKLECQKINLPLPSSDPRNIEEKILNPKIVFFENKITG